MTNPHSAPRRQPTDKHPEVLSDATDLDALLEAILGDDVAAGTPHGRTQEEVTPPAVIAVERSEPSVVAPPLTEVDPQHDFVRDAPVVENDAWGFVSEDSQPVEAIADDSRAVRQNAIPAVASPPRSQRTWRDRLPVALSKRLLLIAALSAGALITASAIRLGNERPATTIKPVEREDGGRH